MTVTLVVNRATPTITWATPAPIKSNQTLATVLNATANTMGSFAYTATPSNGPLTEVTGESTLAIGTYNLAASFTPNDANDYTTATANVSLVVTPVGFVNAPNPLSTPTYDSSGQAMHPSILYFPSAWHGYQYWAAVTPYPNYDASKENPSILASNDGMNWEDPPGITNPVVEGTSNLADPDLYYDAASDQIWMFYLCKVSGEALMMRMTSSDGVTWSTPQIGFTEVYNGMISPAVDRVGGVLYAWYIDASPLGAAAPSSNLKVRTSTDGVTWSAAQVATITQPGYVLWHIEVRKISDGTFWMLAAAYPSGSASGHTVLFFCSSSDGINWTTYSRPVLTPLGTGWDSGQIYRSTFLYDAVSDKFQVWYSARSSTREWQTGYTEDSYADLSAFLAQ
jgi:hypothetical protein